MKCYAAIDIGTNSIKGVLMAQDGAGAWQVLHDEVEIAKLGQGVRETGRLSPEAMERAAAAVGRLTATLRAQRPAELRAVGTMALRRAVNAVDFLARIRATQGMVVDVITGEEEARLSFLGAAGGRPEAAGPVAVTDIGGGSTELILGHDAVLDWRRSLELGALHVTERFLPSDPPLEGEITTARAVIQAALSGLPIPDGGLDLVAIGGTATTLAAVVHELVTYDAGVVHGCRLTCSTVDALIDRFRSVPLAVRKTIPGLPPERADIILAGSLILRGVMERFGAAEIIVSDWGLRHGVILDRFRRAN
jgi:exopolyphosphatase/guanosine-5'-triphosphate,3'-diphosphate pyrophosphatase